MATRHGRRLLRQRPKNEQSPSQTRESGNVGRIGAVASDRVDLSSGSELRRIEISTPAAGVYLQGCVPRTHSHGRSRPLPLLASDGRLAHSRAPVLSRRLYWGLPVLLREVGGGC